MWKYYASVDNVFWDKDSVDKPSQHYLDNLTWEEIDLNLQHKDEGNIEVFLNRDNLRVVKAINDENNQERYYTLKNIVGFAQNGYLLHYEFDNWCSRVLPLMQKDIKVLVDKHQDYDDDKCLEFDEDINLDLSFDQFEVVKQDFSHVIGNSKHFWNKGNYCLVIPAASDPLNGVYCLAINQSPMKTESKLFIPILAQSGVCYVRYPNNTVSVFDIANNVDYDQVVNVSNFNNWYQNNKQYNLVLEITTDKEKIYIYDNDFSNFSFLKLEKWPDKRIRLNCSNNYYYIDKDPDKHVILNVKVVAYTKGNFHNQSYWNNYIQVLELAKSQNYANLVDGLYLIPNILNLTQLWRNEVIDNKVFLTLKVKLSQNEIKDSIVLVDNLKLDKNYKFNNEIPQFKKIFKNYELNWLNNQIDMSLFYDDEKVKINYALNFTNSFNIMTNNKFLNIDNRLLTLPSKQPFPDDTYAKYVAANMNSVNTGYEIQKQQAVLGGVKGVLGSILGGVVGSALGGNALGVISGVGGAANAISSSVVSVKNYEKQIKAKYLDVKNTHGTSILFGSTRDNLWSSLIDDFGQFDLSMIKKLSTDSIIQLNNYYLLNGVYNPKYFKLKDLPKTTAHLGFKYAKLNSVNFNQIFAKHINLPLKDKLRIFKDLEEFRIWDRIPSLE